MEEIRLIEVKEEILSDNKGLADQLRIDLKKSRTFLMNLMSSPGAGKTTFILATIAALKSKLRMGVIEADIDSVVDAEKVAKTGITAIQLRTGGFCHLDAAMVAKGLAALDLNQLDLVIIENVGNLVCPAEFDLGEAHKVVILSVTEGEDKPLKYPDMFAAADVMLLSKCDLLPYLEFDADLAEANARRVNPNLTVFRVSATSGDGLSAWLDWIQSGLEAQRAKRSESVDALKRRVAELERQLAAR